MFKAWPKIPRLENEVYHITEKIDGTNGSIIIKSLGDSNVDTDTIYFSPTGYGVWAQSRTRLITPEKDNTSLSGAEGVRLKAPVGRGEE